MIDLMPLSWQGKSVYALVLSCFHLFEQSSALSGQLRYATITNFEPLRSNLNLEDWDSKQESYYACRIGCSLPRDSL
jgi:hypothetical protein